MKNKQLYLTIPFIVIELVLMILVCFDITGKKIHSYVAIIICFLFSLISLSKNKKVIIIQIGLLFTVISDTFLVLLDAKNQEAGMTTFVVVQLAYWICLLLNIQEHNRMYEVGLRILVIAAAESLVVFVIKDKYDYLCFISIFYFANLIQNIVVAFIIYKKNPYLAIGLLLFALCDIIIGLRSADGYYIFLEENSLLEKMIHSRFDHAWFFYIPAQTLIALSAKFEKEKGAEAP